MAGTVTKIRNDEPEFEERQVEIRGTTYTLRELSAEEYDSCLKMATKPDSDIDMVALLRLMVLKSVKSPKLADTDLGKLPYRVSRRLSTAVNELHFGEDEGD